MPNTLEGAIAIIAFVVPGALLTWQLEGQAGAWGSKQTDRVLRFIGTSAIWHALASPLTYALWSIHLSHGRLRGGEAAIFPVIAVAFGLTILPAVVGYRVGIAARDERSWARFIVGRKPTPTAWDELFRQEKPGWIRLRFMSGGWAAGLYANVPSKSMCSYTAAFPENPELLLARTTPIDQQTGLILTDKGAPVLESSSLLVRFADIRELYFEPAVRPQGDAS